jgi:hypothetical protein
MPVAQSSTRRALVEKIDRKISIAVGRITEKIMQQHGGFTRRVFSFRPSALLLSHSTATA